MYPRRHSITLTVLGTSALVAVIALVALTPSALPAAEKLESFLSADMSVFIPWDDGEGFQTAAEIHYNRVDGLLFFWGVEYTRSSSMHPRLLALRGWPSARADNYYAITLEQPFFSHDSFSLGVSLYDKTAWTREDADMITNTENTLLALFFREEFRNYHRRDGFSIFAHHTFSPRAHVRIEYSNDEISSMNEQQSVWTAFRRGLDWQENPPLMRGILDGAEEYEGVLKGTVAEAGYDGTDEQTGAGWRLDFVTEFAGRSLGGDYDYRKHRVDASHLYVLSPSQTLYIRGAWGIASGTEFPSHKLFHLGGISNLRGYDYNQFDGKNLLFFSVEYGVWVSDGLATIYFMDG
ncbi:BamA/TamA family outer membrane protein, partial [bacterium]|nr:BamA/TamA family outer membrane protein [bacterium]